MTKLQLGQPDRPPSTMPFTGVTRSTGPSPGSSPGSNRKRIRWRCAAQPQKTKEAAQARQAESQSPRTSWQVECHAYRRAEIAPKQRVCKERCRTCVRRPTKCMQKPSHRHGPSTNIPRTVQSILRRLFESEIVIWMWVVSCWICIILYGWSLVAPLAVPDLFGGWSERASLDVIHIHCPFYLLYSVHSS